MRGRIAQNPRSSGGTARRSPLQRQHRLVWREVVAADVPGRDPGRGLGRQGQAQQVQDDLLLRFGLPPGNRRLSTRLKYRCSLPFFRRLHTFKYMPAIIPAGRAPCNGVGLPYTAFDGLITRNARDSAAKKTAPAPKERSPRLIHPIRAFSEAQPRSIV